MAEWIKFQVGQDFTLMPTSCEPNMYNGNPSGYAYTCSNGVQFRASDQLHQMIQEFAPNQGIGQEITISKKQVSNASGRSYQVFTLNGKTLEEHKSGGAMPTSTPPAQAPAPQVTPQVTPNMGGVSLESLAQKVSDLEGQVTQLRNKVDTNSIF